MDAIGPGGPLIMDNEPTRESRQDRIRQLEQTVSELTEKYKILVENANDAIFVLQDGKVKFANPKSLEIAGTVAEDLELSHYTDYLHPEDKEMVVERHQKRIKGQKVLNMYPLRLVNQNGDVVWVEVNAVRIDWEGAPATLNIVRDITTQKMIENQFFQSDNLATVQTLAGGLSHELNNLLMGIQGRASLLSMELGKDNPLHEHLEKMEYCIREAAKLSKQLIGFAQSGKYSIQRVNLNEVLSEVLATMTSSNKRIEVITHLHSDLWTVEVDKSQIDQILINILINAWEAIAQQGRISIRTENISLSKGRRDVQGISSGNYVKISIKDNGIGMDETIRKRVFEPFFTTKQIGRHRGLGLSSAYGITVNHGGMLDIVSSEGVGTTCIILLPAVEDDN
jgi:PAS domain S-box-containing protein